MAESKRAAGAVVSFGWAGLAVGMMLLGRWTPDRLFQSELSELFWILKLGLLLLLALVTAMPGATGPTDRRIPAVGVFLVLMIYTLASYLWNAVPTEYADTKLADLAFNVVLVLVVASGFRRPALRAAFWPTLVGVLGLMAVIGLVSLPTAVATADQGRLSVLGGGPNIFGRNMGILAVACVHFGLRHPRVRLVCGALAGAAAIGVIASGSRGALAATLVGLLALFFLDPVCRRFIVTRPLVVAAFGLVGGAALLVADLGIVAEIGNERIVEQTIQGGYLSTRDTLIAWAWNFWLEAPAFGNGLGAFSLVTPLDYPHNVLMEFLCETGALGLLGFLVFSGMSVFRQMTGGGSERALILPLVALLGVAALASGDFVDSRFLFLFLLYPVVAGGRAIKLSFRTESWSYRGPMKPR